MLEQMGAKSMRQSVSVETERASKRRSLQLNPDDVLIEEHKSITKIFKIYVIAYVLLQAISISLVYTLNVLSYMNDGKVSVLEIIL